MSNSLYLSFFFDFGFGSGTILVNDSTFYELINY